MWQLPLPLSMPMNKEGQMNFFLKKIHCHVPAFFLINIVLLIPKNDNTKSLIIDRTGKIGSLKIPSKLCTEYIPEKNNIQYQEG